MQQKTKTNFPLQHQTSSASFLMKTPRKPMTVGISATSKGSRTQKAFSRQISRDLWNKQTTAHYGTKSDHSAALQKATDDTVMNLQMMEETTRQMMQEICLYRLCERDVSADNGVALD